MELIIPISINCLLAAVVYLIDKYTPAKKLPYIVKQIIIGILFGGVSAFASSYGVKILNTVANVRDAAPLTAGLIFGGPAGIIAGFIGGLYRWFSVYWGAGEYTQLACTIATILAGFIAATIRKAMFDSKKPTWGYGIAIAVVCEVVHMLLIFITNMKDTSYAFQFVKGATIPMIIGNAFAVALSLMLISLIDHERIALKKGPKRIAQTFQRWLLACIVIAYIITSIFTYILQNSMSKIQTEEVFRTAIDDVNLDVREKSDEYMLLVADVIATIYMDNPIVPLEELAAENSVAEINIVTNDGFIMTSTNPDVSGNFNMNDTEQSKEFMVLTQGESYFVQEYGPMGKDGITMRKYAGIALEDGGFIQIGYNREQFHSILNEFVVDVTKNRRVGSAGFIAVCDEDLNLITDDAMNGFPVTSIGINPTKEMKKGMSSSAIHEATIVNKATNYSERYLYVYSFVEGYCIIAAIPKEEAMFMRDASFYNSVFMQVLIFTTMFLFIYLLIKKVIINNLTKINNSLGKITAGDLNVVVDVRTNKEFVTLSDDINSTVDRLKEYIAEAAARIDKELEYAKQIQLSVLPTNFPTSENYEVNANMIAAKEIGGDFYDFYKINDNTVAFLIADVSGKGIPAAMFMMTAKTIIKDLAESGIEVNDIFTRANEKLCETNDSGMFVTAWMGIMDLNTGILKYANAGHNPPLLLRAGGEFEYLKSRAGFVLAGMEGMKYRVNELTLGANDRIFLYTDGVTEATDAKSELYGEDRLLEFMNKNKDVDVFSLLPMLKANIDEFVAEAPQFDDITMLIFDYNPKKGSDIMVNRTFPAKTEELDNVLGFIEELLESFECSMKTTMSVSVAIEEVFVNVAHYAYPDGDGDVTFDVTFDENSRVVTFRMSDSGVPFNPLAKPDPDITLSADERQIGGLGIFITKKTMDSVEYVYENDKNVLIMIKKI